VTIIAVRVEEDFAEILTDTLAYSQQWVELGRTSKGRVFPHLDAFTATSGPGELGMAWQAVLDTDSEPNRDRFDDWTELANACLPAIWEQVRPKVDLDDPAVREHLGSLTGWVCQVGWSEARGRFVGYEYSSQDGWISHDRTESPYFTSAGPAVDVSGAPAPQSDEQWLAWADATFDQLALPTWQEQEDAGLPGRRLKFGDDLILTRLERGQSSQRRIGSIDTGTARFRRSLRGTCHPAGQLGPCDCGKAAPKALCCPGYFDPYKPCVCGSGKQFGDCHLIDPTSDFAAEYWTRTAAEDFGLPGGEMNMQLVHAAAGEVRAYWDQQRAEALGLAAHPRANRNDPCWCGSSRKFKRCHGDSSTSRLTTIGASQT
jgi:hypothetical protein